MDQPEVMTPLNEASTKQNLRNWTTCLTSVVVRSCEKAGWMAAGKANECQRLPLKGQEYLGIDVMAFPAPVDGAPKWPLPLAVFELENDRTDSRVAYSLWKLLCVRALLRIVIAYRPDWERSRQLVGTLAQDVIGGMAPAERTALPGETVVIVGNRGEGETFPWGYFKFWKLDANLGRFEKI